jgi:tetratricopeptide (TPR) repeat protein
LAAAQDAGSALAWEQEVAHYETALRTLDEFESPDDAARCRILLRLADRYVFMGGDHRGTYRRAADLARRHNWADMLAEAANGIGRVREYGTPDPEVVALLEAALTALGEIDSHWRARVLGRLADVLAVEGQALERRDALSREGLEVARRLEDPQAVLSALLTRRQALAGPDRIDEKRQLLSEGLAIGPEDWHAAFHRELYELHAELGDMDAARAHLQRLWGSVAERRQHGTYGHSEAMRLRAAEAIVDGRLADAEQLAGECQKLWEVLEDPDAPSLWAAQTLPIRLEQDRGDELVEAVAERAHRSSAHAAWRCALCLLHARAGRTEDARAELHELVARDCAAIPRLDDWLAALTMLADACVELREANAAARLAHLLAPYATRFPAFFYSSGPMGPVSRRLGRLAHVCGRSDDAVQALEHALASSQAIRAPIWTAHARRDLALVVLDTEPGRAAELLERARDDARALGLVRLQHDIARLRAGASVL